MTDDIANSPRPPASQVPPGGWLQSDDGTSNIVRNDAARRKRFATTISDATFVPPPPAATDALAANDLEVGARPSVRIVILNSSALIKAFELAIDFDPAKQQNQPPPELILDFKLDDPQARSEIRELIAELKKLNAHLEASREPDSANKINLTKYLDAFLSKHAETVGTGSGYLVLGAISSLLIYLGASEVVGLAMAWKTLNK